MRICSLCRQTSSCVNFANVRLLGVRRHDGSLAKVPARAVGQLVGLEIQLVPQLAYQNRLASPGGGRLKQTSPGHPLWLVLKHVWPIFR